MSCQFLLLTNIGLLLLLGAAIWRIWIQRGWVRWANSELGILQTPIPAIELGQLDPLFQEDELGPSLETEVYLLGGFVLGGTTEKEAWILSNLAKKATSMFEFGTATGRTAYLWARNSAAGARIVTLTLPPHRLNQYRHAAGDTSGARRRALVESGSSRFYYSGTPVEYKITQLYADSKALDSQSYAGQFDLIFIDGSHAYSYVKSDTEKALVMLKEGGIILWHDYLHSRVEVKGVYDYLNELSRTLPLRHIRNTRLVCYRAPVQTSPSADSGTASIPDRPL